ncbi:MAG: hypothetical protein OXC48_06630 [Endozoicomonadaceae bacterium]|nr:hypothetical protein [Endozoicomonadaceae bacterium]
MSSEHFTLTISQNSTNEDYSIHLKDCKHNHEHFIMQLHFGKSVAIDGLFIDDIVTLIARRLAKKIVEKQLFISKSTDENILNVNEEQAKQIVADALKKITKALKK